MSDKIIAILLSVFGESFVKRLILRMLIALKPKVEATDNSVDDLILQALIEAFGGEVDDDHLDGESVNSEDVSVSQLKHSEREKRLHAPLSRSSVG